MIVIFWNLQRPGKGGTAIHRLQNILLYLEVLTHTFNPDLICLCEVTPQQADELSRRSLKSKEYGGEVYIHKSQEKQEFISNLSSSSFFSSGTQQFLSESACSFFVLYRRKTFPKGIRLFVPKGGQFFYQTSGELIDDLRGPQKVLYTKEARPLVLIQSQHGVVGGVVHLISGNPGMANQQLQSFLVALKQAGGRFVIGDMNIDLGNYKFNDKKLYLGFSPTNPGYFTHPKEGEGSTTLDYIWTAGDWNVVRPSAMPKMLLESYFLGEGRMSDHAPVIYQLDNQNMMHPKVPDLPPLPWLPKTVKTRHSKPPKPTKHLFDEDMVIEFTKEEFIKPLFNFKGFEKVRPTYVPNLYQNGRLLHFGLANVDIAPDGDCFFAALVRVGATGFAGLNTPRTPFATVGALRTHVANGLQNSYDLRFGLFTRDLNPDTVGNRIRSNGLWNGEYGDVVPEITARVLGIQIRIIDSNGNTYVVGVGGPIFTLLRFSDHGAEHYHATQ